MSLCRTPMNRKHVFTIVPLNFLSNPFAIFFVDFHLNWTILIIIVIIYGTQLISRMIDITKNRAQGWLTS